MQLCVVYNWLIFKDFQGPTLDLELKGIDVELPLKFRL